MLFEIGQENKFLNLFECAWFFCKVISGRKLSQFSLQQRIEREMDILFFHFIELQHLRHYENKKLRSLCKMRKKCSRNRWKLFCLFSGLNINQCRSYFWESCVLILHSLQSVWNLEGYMNNQEDSALAISQRGVRWPQRNEEKWKHIWHDPI